MKLPFIISKEKQEEINQLEFREVSSKMKDRTGEVSGRLYILGAAPKQSNKSYWWAICSCPEHNIIKIRGDAIGRTQSCGCLQKEKAKEQGKSMRKDLTNQTFTYLTALYPIENAQKNGVIWHCKCKCGNEVDVRSTDLLSQNTKSCGCLRKEHAHFKQHQLHLENQTFGYLTVLEETEKREFGKIVWKCQCDCGKIVYLNTSRLTNGNDISCGCKKKSFGELQITKILSDNNINFKQQYCFQDLSNRFFDFAIFNPENKLLRLVEFDGEQHYRITGGWNNEERFYQNQQRDQEKNQWAKNNNIPLVRIPYWERDNITLDMIMGDKYLI